MSRETSFRTHKTFRYMLAASCVVVLLVGCSVSNADMAQRAYANPLPTTNAETSDTAPSTDDQDAFLFEPNAHPETKATAVVLSVGKTGPTMAWPGEPITFTLAITNSGDSVATGVIITDVLPSGAHYAGGGTLMLDGIVGWTVESIAAGGHAKVQFAVTATQTVTNSDYRVSCTEGVSATGTQRVVTSIAHRVYQPLVQGSHAPGYVYTYTIINTYPHDSEAFTQGLVFTDGVLYEGTGLWGRSTLRRVALETGEILQSYDLPSEYFGEGITIVDDKIIQLTWKSKVGFVYDKESFGLLHEFHYPTEGWGITYDGEHLIMSDGTSTLHFWDPQTFEEIGQVRAYDEIGPVTRLNELEYVQGEVYANVWQTDRIARIDPQTGRVTGWIDLTGLLDRGTPSPSASGQGVLRQPVDVLNGIAYDGENDRLFVTGKLWPTLFEIELVISY